MRELGGRIAIVTNRTVSECPDTEAVFGAHELAFDVILCKPDAGPSDKNPRFAAVAKGTTPAGLPPLEIVAFVGDNIYDFPTLSQEIREQGDEAFADFGVRFFSVAEPDVRELGAELGAGACQASLHRCWVPLHFP